MTGTIRVAGQDIYDAQTDEADLRRRVGMVFQQPNPFPFSVYDNVTYGLRLAGITDPQVLAERVETSLKQAAVWQETKDHLKITPFLFRRQATADLHCPVLAVQPKLFFFR